MVDTTTIIQLPEELEGEFLIFRIMDIEIRGMDMEELVTLQESLNSIMNSVIIKDIQKKLVINFMVIQRRKEEYLLMQIMLLLAMSLE